MTRPRRAVVALAFAAAVATSACDIVNNTPRVVVRFVPLLEQQVAPADAPPPSTTMYAPIPEPKTPCDEYPVERAAEPQGCYVQVPHE